MKKYIDGLLILGIGACLFTLLRQNKVIENYKSQPKNVDSLVNVINMQRKLIDSLGVECFQSTINIGRYEYIIDRAKDELSKDCYEQLEYIISNTE